MNGRRAYKWYIIRVYDVGDVEDVFVPVFYVGDLWYNRSGAEAVNIFGRRCPGHRVRQLTVDMFRGSCPGLLKWVGTCSDSAHLKFAQLRPGQRHSNYLQNVVVQVF